MAFWKKNKEPKESRHEEKKVGLLRRLWRKIRGIDWKNPINRWKLLFATLFAFIGMLGFAYGAIAFTSNPSFCASCHEMAPEHVTFEASAHSEIKCTQCHIEPGAKNMVVHKVESLKEVYYHIVGPPDPIVQTVPVKNVNCIQCHSENRLVSATGDLIINHKEHIDEKIPCITCHSGVAHAKVVERGINDSTSYDYWTLENAEKLMGKEYMNPNMGTCIDCHDQVNKGKEPWKDWAYSLPENTHGKEHDQKEDSDGHEVEATELTVDATTKASHIKTQDLILQAIGKQKTDVKISMECFTCHQEINTPKNHDNVDWNKNHGGNALESLDTCMNCHQDSKWIKHMPKQDIEQLVKIGNQKENYTKNIAVVKTEARQNQFCSTCHTDRPEGHTDSDKWLTSHANDAKSNEQKANCFVCHDNEKPNEQATEIKAPTDVYCQFCHRTGFKNGKL